jgi:uncharacterized protein YciI
MKAPITILLFAIAICCATATVAQEKKAESTQPAEKKYEMKQYFFVMLSRGDNINQDSATAAKIQEGHMANMGKLADMGKLIVAGPFGDRGNWRGIFIMDCKTKEEAEDLIKTDPAIVAGRLKYEIHPWWTAKNCVFK